MIAHEDPGVPNWLDPAGNRRGTLAVRFLNAEAVPAVAEAVKAGDVVIHNHPTGVLVPSDADLAIASRLGGDGIGFYIVDNDARRVYVVVEPSALPAAPDPLDPEEVATLLGPDGALADAHPNYEVRPSQGVMAADVARILDGGSVGLLEAGTGTGKSLAYLIPAAMWALRGKRRVVISTRTINLQEQHLVKDLPIVSGILGGEVKTALIKGRGNYLCLRKRDLLDTDTGEVLLEFEDVTEVRQLLQWSRATADGSLSDLSFVPRDANWNLLKAESDSCLRARCPHFSACFFYRSRIEAASAQVLLANHHILFADLALRGSGHEAAAIMPRYDAVIIDEAHNIEDVAASYFDASIGRWSLLGHLGRLVSRRKADRGLIPFLVSKLAATRSLSGERRSDLADLCSAVMTEVQTTRGQVDRIFEEMAAQTVSWLGGGRNGAESRWRVPLARRNEEPWRNMDRLLGELEGALNGVSKPLRRLNRRLRNLVDDGIEDLIGPWGDIGAVVSRIDAGIDFIGRVREGEVEGEVFWLETRARRGRRSVNFHLTPLQVADILENTLFAGGDPVVMTSATLTVGGSFDFLREKFGIHRLGEREIVEETYPTPFDMAGQMHLALLDDIPDPGGQGHVLRLSETVARLVSASGGGALVLFTTYRTLDSVFERCSGDLEGQGIQVIRQGEAPRTALMDRFRSDPDMTLFATDSFWEGVDVVGQALRQVIIARLPFPVPTDPVVEARGEALIREGRDPFMEDSVPRAVLRLRQGVGRLIRHRDDRGYAVICDPRILRRAYGRVFVDSFGGYTIERGGTELIADNLKGFLGM